MNLRSIVFCISLLRMALAGTRTFKSTGAMTEIPTTDAAVKVTVSIHQKYLLNCSAFSHQEGVDSIGWYRCSTSNCSGEWNGGWIAHVSNTTGNVTVDPRFEVFPNGTLVFQTVQPDDDAQVFICKVRIPHGGLEKSETIFSVAQEEPRIRLRNSPLYQVVKGTTLHLDCGATGFPPPLVIWFRVRDRKVLLNRTNEGATSLVLRNFTEGEEGIYSCTATNSLGSDSYEVQVQSVDLSYPPWTRPTDNQGGRDCETTYKWTTYLLLALFVMTWLYLIRVKCSNKGSNQIGGEGEG